MKPHHRPGATALQQRREGALSRVTADITSVTARLESLKKQPENAERAKAIHECVSALKRLEREKASLERKLGPLSKAEKLIDRGSFAQYADDEID